MSCITRGGSSAASSDAIVSKYARIASRPPTVAPEQLTRRAPTTRKRGGP